MQVDVKMKQKTILCAHEQKGCIEVFVLGDENIVWGVIIRLSSRLWVDWREDWPYLNGKALSNRRFSWMNNGCIGTLKLKLPCDKLSACCRTGWQCPWSLLILQHTQQCSSLSLKDRLLTDICSTQISSSISDSYVAIRTLKWVRIKV